MIIYEENDYLYSTLANNYIKTFIDIFEEQMNDEITNVDELICYFPKLVFIENRDKCLNTFYKIREWATDNYNHYLGSLEKYLIVKILKEIDRLIDEYGIYLFCDIYLKESGINIIEHINKIYKEDCEDDFSFTEEIKSEEEMLEFYIASDMFLGVLFMDLDYEMIDSYTKNDTSLATIDPYFYDVMPSDIVNRAKNNLELLKVDLYNFIQCFKEIVEKSFYRIYGFDKYKERDFQILFELYSKSYNAMGLEFKKVYKEPEIGDGEVDFIVSFPFSGEVLFEFKMDNKFKVMQSINNQIPEYLERLKQQKAVILIFSKELKNDYQKLCFAIREKRSLEIIPILIEVGKKETPSKMKP